MLHFKNKEKIIILAGFSLIVAVSISSIYFYIQYQKVKKSLLETNVKNQDVKPTFLEELAKSTGLPRDEEPTVVRINDAERAKTQPFFSKAKNGEIVLLYKKPKRAILYDPLEKKILESGPLLEGSGSARP